MASRVSDALLTATMSLEVERLPSNAKPPSSPRCKEGRLVDALPLGDFASLATLRQVIGRRATNCPGKTSLPWTSRDSTCPSRIASPPLWALWLCVSFAGQDSHTEARRHREFIGIFGRFGMGIFEVGRHRRKVGCSRCTQSQPSQLRTCLSYSRYFLPALYRSSRD
jgi:hypothetical protein